MNLPGMRAYTEHARSDRFCRHFRTTPLMGANERDILEVVVGLDGQWAEAMAAPACVFSQVRGFFVRRCEWFTG
jgi:hypothetical protein